MGDVDQRERIQSGGVDVTNDLNCPVCMKLPKAEVYQCEGGHTVCSECYFQLEVCPECREELDHWNPIRNLKVERLLDHIIKIECPFKENGCGKKTTRNIAENHASGCHYNFPKFGNLVNLCEKLGYPSCNFKFNNGNTALAIQHFTSEHGFHMTESQKFQMELKNFQRVIFLQNSSQSWTPVIVKLSGSQGHLLLAPILTKAGHLTYLSVWLPDSSSFDPSVLQIAQQVAYVIQDNEASDSIQIRFVQTPKTIAEAATSTLESLPSHLPILKQPLALGNKRSLKIACEIEANDESVPGNGVTASDLETFECKVNPPETDLSVGATEKAKKCLEHARNHSKIDRDFLWIFLCKLFDDKTNPDGLTDKEKSYLKKSSIFLVLDQGTVAQLDFLKNKGYTFSNNFTGDVSPLQYLLKMDANKQIGLEKVKALVKSGVDFHRVTESGKTLLHYASFYGTEHTVKYVLEELQLDVNAQTVKGNTPLHCAVKNKSKGCALKIIQLLLSRGADPQIRNGNGQDFLEPAKHCFRRKLEDLLRSHESQLPNNASSTQE